MQNQRRIRKKSLLAAAAIALHHIVPAKFGTVTSFLYS